MSNKKLDIYIRTKYVKYALENGVSAASKKFNTSRVTITKWVNRYKENGDLGLTNNTKLSNSHPDKMPKDLFEKILDLKKKYPKWGGKKIKEYLNIDYSPQVINKKLRQLTQSSFDEIDNSKPFRNLFIKLIKLNPLNNKSSFYQIDVIDQATGMLFIGFTYEKSNLAVTIFMDYLLKNLLSYGINIEKINIITNNSSQFISRSVQNKSLFQWLITEKYKLSHTNCCTTATIKYNENKYPIFNYKKASGKLLYQVLSFVIFNNNFRHDLNAGQKIKAILKQHCLDVNSKILSIPPIIVDKYIKDIDKIKSLEEYWYIPKEINDKILDTAINYFDSLSKEAEKKVLLEKAEKSYKMLNNFLKLKESNLLQLNTIQKRAEILMTIGEWSEAQNLYFEALELSEKMNDTKNIMKIKIAIVSRMILKGEHKKVHHLIDDIMILSKKVKSKVLIGDMFLNISRIYSSEMNYNKAFKYINKIIDDKGFHKYKKLYMKAVLDLASIYHNKGNYENAIKYNKKLLILAKKNDFKAAIAAGYGNLGTIYSDLKFTNKAYENYIECLKVARQLRNKNYISLLFGNFGNIYNEWGDKFRSEKLYNKQLVYAKKMDDHKTKALVYGNLAYLYYNLFNDYNRSLKFLTKSIDIVNKYNLPRQNFFETSLRVNIALAVKDYAKVKIYMSDFEKCLTQDFPDHLKFVVYVLKIEVQIEENLNTKQNPKQIIDDIKKLEQIWSKFMREELHFMKKSYQSSELLMNIIDYLKKTSDLYPNEKYPFKDKICYYIKNLEKDIKILLKNKNRIASIARKKKEIQILKKQIVCN